jgi:hypothetical protein
MAAWSYSVLKNYIRKTIKTDSVAREGEHPYLSPVVCKMRPVAVIKKECISYPVSLQLITNPTFLYYTHPAFTGESLAPMLQQYNSAGETNGIQRQA